MSSRLSHQISLDRLTKASNEMTWVATGQVLTLLAGIVTVKMFTTLLGPREYGQLALGLTMAGVLNMFIYGPLGQVVFRFFSVYRDRGQLPVYLFVLARIHVILWRSLAVVVVVAGLLVATFISLRWASVVVAALSFGVVSGISNALVLFFSAVRRRQIAALHQGGDSWLRFVLAVMACLLFGRKSYFVLLGYFLATLAIVSSELRVAVRDRDVQTMLHSPPPGRDTRAHTTVEFYSYARSICLFAGFAAISAYADRWILQALVGDTKVGVYAAVYQVAMGPIALLFGIINQFAIPIVFQKAGAMRLASQPRSSIRVLYLVATTCALVISPLIIITYFFSASIMRFFTAAAFVEGHELLWVITMSLALFNLGDLLTVKGMSYNRPGDYLSPKVIQAVWVVLFMYLGTRRLGLEGAAWALCSASLIYLLMVLFKNGQIGRSVNR